jgi:hypothetical protein
MCAQWSTTNSETAKGCIMAETIQCPNCSFEFELTEVLSTKLRDRIRKEFEAESRKKEAEFHQREEEVRKREAEVEKSKRRIEDELTRRIEKQREQITKQALKDAEKSVVVEMEDLKRQLKETENRLTKSQQAEIDLRKERRNLEDEKRQLEITVNRRLDDERRKIRETVKNEAAEEHRLKDADKEKLISDLRRQIEDLKRKSEQGSQQSQGEVLELELEDFLRTHFSHDVIEPVAKGNHGGDVLQIVRDGNGFCCGTILWESKRTKTWSNKWLAKLRNDQRTAKAEIAAVLTVAMPNDVATFAQVDGIWVTNRACLAGLATALRGSLIEIASSKRTSEGRHGKMELLYNYLASPEFRHRVEGIVEAFTTMRDDLEAEKRAILGAWARREKQLERALTSAAGLHGDLSGIIGGSIAAVESLEMLALADAPTDSTPQKKLPSRRRSRTSPN